MSLLAACREDRNSFRKKSRVLSNPAPAVVLKTGVRREASCRPGRSARGSGRSAPFGVAELDPGGWIYERAVPAAWYAQAWWRVALTTGAGLFGGMMVFDILASSCYDLVDYGTTGWGESY